MFKNILMLVASIVVLSGCDNSGSSKKNDGTVNPEGGPGSYIASYEAMDGCTTESHVFSTPTEAEMETVFCHNIKQGRLNNFCAEDQRESIFKLVQCPGQFRDTNNNNGGVGIVGATYTKHYVYHENECGTGIHTFSASTERDSNKLFCRALKNDTLNNNCAKTARNQKHYEMQCDRILQN